MAMTDTAPETDATTTPLGDDAGPSRPTPRGGLASVLGSTDHRVVGRIFVVLSLIAIVVDLGISALVYLDIAGDGVLESRLVARFAANHGIALFVDALALFVGIGIIVVPRQVGAAAIAFPRAAAAAAWSWALSTVIWAVAVFFGGSYGGFHADLVRLGNVAVGATLAAIVLGSICIATTVLSSRPMGMGLGDVPFFAFSMLVASVLWIFTLPSAIAHVTLGHITRANPATLLSVTFDQGLSWLLHQPAVYVMAIPILGVALDAAAHLSGTAPRFRGVLLTMIGAYGLFSFGAWAQSALAVHTLVWFGFALLIAPPVLVVLGAALDTLRAGGKLKLVSPLAFGLLALLVLLLGCLIGVLRAIDEIGRGQLVGFQPDFMANAQLYFVFGAALVGGLGACFYWGRLVFGSPLPDNAGKGLAPLGLLAVVLMATPVALVGLLDPDGDVVQVFAGFAAAGAALLALVTLAALGAGLSAMRTAARGDELLPDPWGDAGTLEWVEEITVVSIDSPYPLRDGGSDEKGAS